MKRCRLTQLVHTETLKSGMHYTTVCDVLYLVVPFPFVHCICTNLVNTADCMLCRCHGQKDNKLCPHVHLEYLYNAHVLFLGCQFGLKGLLLVEEWGCIHLPSALLDLMQCCLR